MITIKYETQTEADQITTEYLGKGYRVAEIRNHVDGDFLVFGPPTKYHTLNEINESWTFDEDQWIDKEVRPERNEKLQETDYMMLYDNRSQLSVNDLKRWTDYRQALRDVPANISTKISSPIDVQWPSLLVNENNLTQER